MSAILRAGIIAAGNGTRLASSHPGTPKPMVLVRGKPLVEWVVSSIASSGIRHILMLVNARGKSVREHLKKKFPSIQWTFLVKDTASSWESFRLVSRALAGTSERFLISTVDALIPPLQAQHFTQTASVSMQAQYDAALAITPFVEDENPLWAEMDRRHRVTGLGLRVEKRSHATCGLYALTRRLTEDMPEASAHERLRDWWMDIVDAGRPVLGVLLDKTLDVDRPQDILLAETFLHALEESPS